MLELPIVGRCVEAEFGLNQLRSWRIPLDAERAISEVDLLERPLSDPAVALRPRHDSEQ